MRTNILLSFLIWFCSVPGLSQSDASLKWWNPSQNEFAVVEGQAWPKQVESFYDRLPASAQQTVRTPVWNLSRHAAGLMIRFRTNAANIVVRYQVGGDLEMNHMPATGVSGVDLYAIGSDGDWLWCRGNLNFSDTITYRFNKLRPNDGYHKMGREYRLYLPLFNRVEWLEIGVTENSYFNALPVRMEKPIVVYGTSIAHGACASRPGMAWTSILGRKLDRPLINLAFSGNGRLEKELIDLLTQIDPKIYILDCLPNLWNKKNYSDEELTKRILDAVRQLKEKRPYVPILLTEHAGYTDGLVTPERKEAYTRVNVILEKAFAQLKSEAYQGLYLLSNEEINLQLDDMVDGTHPNDLGMMHYAVAYEVALRSILKEPKGNSSTTQACIQYREPGNYDWEERHRQLLEMNRTEPPKSIIFGNSIIHFWGGFPRSKLVREEASWENFFTPAGVRNFAFGWDRIENVLWRVYHDELDGYEAEQILLMVGTNNLHLNSDTEILSGLSQLIAAVQFRQPNARIILAGLLPRDNKEARIVGLNLQISKLAGARNVQFADAGKGLLEENGKINNKYFSDGLHPNAAGYQQLFNFMKPLLSN